MVFNSFLFFGFFALTGILFDLVNRQYRWILLLIASVAFISYASFKGIAFLLVSSLITYYSTITIDNLYQKKENKNRERTKAKIIVSIDVIINLGILFSTKYLNFFGSIVATVTGRTFTALSLVIPLGISFYTFMIIGYAIDVYREEYRPQRNYFKLLLFAAYFPQLIDGPISRYDQVQEALFNPPDIEYRRCRDGMMLFAWGLFKKLCVADNIKFLVDLIYDNYHQYQGLLILVGAIAYAIYIYADFSGCISMARGVSRYFGIELKDNFNHPYFASSVEEFWRRWHMTLSLWFKDYLFYPVLRSAPLSRMSKKLRDKGQKKLSRLLPTSLALLVVWLFTGLWHGAKSTYVIWGLYYGFILILATIINTYKKKKEMRFKPLHILMTFLIVCFGYLFFNAASLSDAIGMIKSIFVRKILNFETIVTLGISFYKQVGDTIYFIVSCVSITVFIYIEIITYKGKDLYCWFLTRNKVVKYLFVTCLAFFLLLMMNRSSGDFTYMQF